MAIENTCFGIEAFSRRQFAYALKCANAIFLAADVPGRKNIAGYALGYLRRSGRSAGHAARLYSIAVSPDFRGMSIGGSLLSAVEDEFRRRGCRRVFLEVHEDNRTAAALYESRGYVRRGYEEGYYRDGKAAFKYVRSV